MKKYIILILLIFGQSVMCSWSADHEVPWSIERANEWQKQAGWLVGCNFTPSTAINELEMWQASTFDLQRIDLELGWAQQLGFNSVRVFLHSLLWQQDSKGFLDRISLFLAVADKHQIKVAFVLFDSCWNPDSKLGEQPLPRPFVHNSGWVQSPGRYYMDHPDHLDDLKPYVQGIVGHFRNDTRIIFWDVFNEPDNLNIPAYDKYESSKKLQSSLLLLRKVLQWAREVKPIQPLTSGVWKVDWTKPEGFSDFEKIQLGQSDIITFHNYGSLDGIKKIIRTLRDYGRPMVCTEYMARPMGSTFSPILGYFKDQSIGAFNWGFVSGKTQTIYPWDSWAKAYSNEPPLWFHDILLNNGTAYNSNEVAYIRKVTKVEPPK